MNRICEVLLLLLLPICQLFSQEYRTLTGTNNNLSYPEFGAANSNLIRLVNPQYEDGIQEPIKLSRPGSREISNEICHQSSSIPDNFNRSDFFWCFGQFIDHDIVINRGNSGEVIIIRVPGGDVFFDPENTGNRSMQLSRSKFDQTTGTNIDNPRQHINEQSAYIDGSVIYGVDLDRLNYIRAFQDGKLRVSEGNNLPFNTIDGEYESEVDFSAPLMELPTIPRPEKYYINGDIRANENPGLLALHTLFVREHNRLCDSLKQAKPTLSDEELFQQARKFIGAYIQSITYNEWLPQLGVILSDYQGYNGSINAGISNMFSAVAFRFGHSLVNEQILRVDNDGTESAYGMVQIAEAFFNADKIVLEGGIEPILKGMAHQVQQSFDAQIVGSLRNFLFGNPSNNGLDLASLNIERGRERGIPGFNSIRQAYGLEPYQSFGDFTDNAVLANSLEELYGDINDVDPWIGFLCEKKSDEGKVGETFKVVMLDQFERLRDGDRFWYENDDYFSDEQKVQISNTTLADIIKRNTSITNIVDQVFQADRKFFTVTSTIKEIKSLELKIYPNPASKYINVNVGSWAKMGVKVKMFDFQGNTLLEDNLLLERGTNDFTFEISEIPTGIYIFAVISGKRQILYKFYKN